MDWIKLRNQIDQVKGNDQGPLPFYFFLPMPAPALGNGRSDSLQF